jgi:Spy/CpxP family protein refolding chaperone
MNRLGLILLILCIPLLAQPPRGFYAWWDSPVARDLNLSDDQVNQIRTTVKEYRSKLVDLRATLEKAEIDVEDAFNEDNFDQKRASDAIDHLASSRAELTRTFSQMSLRLRAVLTPDQWRELQKRRPRLLRQPGPTAPKGQRNPPQ